MIKSASFESAENSLWSLENTDPTEEAQKAISAGDTRLLGIQSAALSVPGVPPDAYDRYVSKDTVRIIEGTSDYVSDDTARKLMQKAGPYAEQYNKRVVEHLRR